MLFRFCRKNNEILPIFIVGLLFLAGKGLLNVNGRDIIDYRRDGDFVNGQYEKHIYPDRNFPIIFHTDMRRLDRTTPVPEPIRQAHLLEDDVGLHWHEGIEILCFFQGSAFVRINDETISVDAGQIVLINSGRLHEITALDSICVYHCLILNADLCHEWGFDPENTVYATVFPAAPYGKLINAIATEFNKKDKYYKTLVTAYCMELMARLSRERLSREVVPSRAIIKKTSLVQQILRYIHNNFEQPLTLDDIGTAMGYSRFYISHIFTTYTGMTVIDYLQQVRIRMSQEMLTKGELPISVVAEKCGYRNVSAFSAAFRRQTGQSPSGYRRITRRLD